MVMKSQSSSAAHPGSDDGDGDDGDGGDGDGDGDGDEGDDERQEAFPNNIKNVDARSNPGAVLVGLSDAAELAERVHHRGRKVWYLWSRRRIESIQEV